MYIIGKGDKAKTLSDTDFKKIVALLESMSDTIYEHQRHIKPSKADKARQARLMLKKLKKQGKL